MRRPNSGASFKKMCNFLSPEQNIGYYGIMRYISLVKVTQTCTKTSSIFRVYNRISVPVSISLQGWCLSGWVWGQLPLQACRESANTPRTRARLEPAIDKTCRPRLLHPSHKCQVVIFAWPQLNTRVSWLYRAGVRSCQGAQFCQ